MSVKYAIAIPSIPACPSISRVILYVKDIPKVAAFYETFFWMKRATEEPGWLELESPSGGCCIALHQASKTQKSGAAVKLVFEVSDVQKFVDAAAARGLKFGPVHGVRNGLGHEFANAKDPAGNSISISSRGCQRSPSQLS